MSNSDLMDQRDQMIAELSRMVGLTANFKPDGTATIFIDNFPAVQDGAHRTFEYGEDSDGRPQLFLATNSGQVEVTSGLSGHMGGKLTAYDAAQSFLTDMDTFVTDFATQMNTQHASGFDLNGNKVQLSADTFSVSCGAINSAALLLRSANDKHPNGLANSSGCVGRNYMCHINTILCTEHGFVNDTEFEKTFCASRAMC